MSHTPTPWRVGDAGHTVFGPPNGTFPKVIAADLRGSDSRFIVLSCNAHDDLVEALDFLVKTADSAQESGHTESECVAGNWDVLGPMAREALKLANGELR